MVVMRPLPLLLGCLCLLHTGVASAQSGDALKNTFDQESRLLDLAIDEYGQARAAERSAISELGRLHMQLDEALEDPNITLDYLNRLESQLAEARDRACASLEKTARARQNMYARMERLADVARNFEEQTELFGTAREGLTGMWQLEVQPLDLYGLINLRLEGSQVSGPYRLSNGNQGSVRGTLAGHVLRLEAVDSERGVIADIEAEVDTAAGEIRGEWRARVLGGTGLPAVGDWIADKVSSQEEIDLDY
jgi:hypothetical protein